MSTFSKFPQGVLLLSSGSKVAIAQAARQSILNNGATLHGSDRTHDCPTRHFVDQFTVFKETNAEAWIKEILRYCELHHIGLVIPTRHQELVTLANTRNRFAESEIALSLSSITAIEICNNKLNTFKFLRENAFPLQ